MGAGFSVWFDRARLNPGCDWHQEIEAGCEAARVIVPLLTPNWQRSPWTKYETYASDAVIPLRARGKREAVAPPPLRKWDIRQLNPRTADDAAWESLFAAIRAKLAEPAPERAPRIVDLPHPANPFFTGRDADLVRIHEELHEAPVAALTQGRVRALAAMGGVGKTTLANEYARRFWRLYPQILWVDARAGLESGFALLFEKLFPARAGEELKQEDKARLALAELSGKQDRLLVIDNVEDAESVRPWLPRDPTTGCRTLITSRFSDWPPEQGIRTITLYVLEPECLARQKLGSRGLVEPHISGETDPRRPARRYRRPPAPARAAGSPAPWRDRRRLQAPPLRNPPGAGQQELAGWFGLDPVSRRGDRHMADDGCETVAGIAPSCACAPGMPTRRSRALW